MASSKQRSQEYRSLRELAPFLCVFRFIELRIRFTSFYCKSMSDVRASGRFVITPYRVRVRRCCSTDAKSKPRRETTNFAEQRLLRQKAIQIPTIIGTRDASVALGTSSRHPDAWARSRTVSPESMGRFYRAVAVLIPCAPHHRARRKLPGKALLQVVDCVLLDFRTDTSSVQLLDGRLE